MIISFFQAGRKSEVEIKGAWVPVCLLLATSTTGAHMSGSIPTLYLSEEAEYTLCQDYSNRNGTRRAEKAG